jgi:hypothetical protein
LPNVPVNAVNAVPVIPVMLQVDVAFHVAVGIAPPFIVCVYVAPAPKVVVAAVLVTTPPLLVIVPVIILFAAVKLVKFNVFVSAVLAFIIIVPAIAVFEVVVLKAIEPTLVPVLLNCNVEPLATVRAFDDAGAVIVNKPVVIADCKLTLVFPVTISCLMVPDGTAVTVIVVPLLNCIISVVAGVVRVGDQFVLTAQLPPVAPIHVYVVCALANAAKVTSVIRRTNFFIQSI